MHAKYFLITQPIISCLHYVNANSTYSLLENYTKVYSHTSISPIKKQSNLAKNMRQSVLVIISVMKSIWYQNCTDIEYLLPSNEAQQMQPGL